MIGTVKILAVDDVEMNLEMLGLMLSEIGDFFLKARNGREALAVLEQHEDTDAILLDLQMPGMDGFELLPLLKRDDRYRHIPVIVVASDRSDVLRSLSLGANDFLAKPYNPAELKLRVLNHLRGKKLRDLSNDMSSVLEREVVKKTAELRKALQSSRQTEFEISLRLGKAAEFRDAETGMHIRRISEFSKILGELAGLGEKACEILRYSSPLHDVGKIGIPDRILLKPGKLDPAEFDIMKMHTVIGGKILSAAQKYPVISAGQIIALQHHERWDGSGYPNGLSGEKIHIFGRIVMIVDIYDALRSHRPYKKAFSVDETVRVMWEDARRFFDPRLFSLFLTNLDRFESVRERLKDKEGDEVSLLELAMSC